MVINHIPTSFLSISAKKIRKRRLRPPVPVGGLNESFFSEPWGKSPAEKRLGAPGVAVFFFFLMVKKGDGLEKMFENGWGNQSTLQQDVMSLVLLRD